jgi:C-terminal processing protease CtpA/Prc
MGEYFCLLLKAGNPNTLFLGDTTAGAIGEFTIIPLYGNAGVSYTGNGILINNETFQQRGIPPDIRVVKNRNDIINNKDAELIKTIELAKGRK